MTAEREVEMPIERPTHAHVSLVDGRRVVVELAVAVEERMRRSNVGGDLKAKKNHQMLVTATEMNERSGEFLHNVCVRCTKMSRKIKL